MLTLASLLWGGGKKDDSSGADDTESPDHNSSLMDSIETDDMYNLERLLELDVNLNEKDEFGRTALHLAVESGRSDAVAMLLASGAYIDAQDDRGHTPLLLAVEGGRFQITEILSNAGADLSIQDNAGRSPADLALEKPAIRLQKLITPETINMEATEQGTLLHAAAARGLPEHIAVLLNNGADINLRGRSGLRALDLALEPDVDIQKIRGAAVLIKRGALPPQKKEWGYIVEPLRSGNMEVGFSYNAKALHIAAEYGHDAMVVYLIENGADVNARDQPGNTALHIAVRNANKDIASFLLDKGALINAQDSNGNTPLHESLTAYDEYAITTMLLERGANPSLENKIGSTPLHFAALMENDAVAANLLLNHGAPVDARDIAGNTPLLFAVESGKRELAELLLSKNAYVFARNNKGQTPAEEAVKMGESTAAWFFSVYLASINEEQAHHTSQ